MEAPKPIIKPIEIVKDDIKYNLTLKNSSNKLEIVIEDNSLIPNFYMNIYSKEELSNLSNFFNMFENIDDIIPSIIDMIKNNQYTINNSNDEFSLIISPYIKNVKIIQFNLKENEIDKNLLLKKLINSIKKIENENKNLKERLLKIENNLEIKEQKNKSLFEGTTLLSDDEKNLIDNWILENIEKKFNLLYKLTIDGDESSTFHSKCDGKGPTIKLVMQFGVEIVMDQFLEVDMIFILVIIVKVKQVELILLVLIKLKKKMDLQEDKVVFM